MVNRKARVPPPLIGGTTDVCPQNEGMPEGDTVHRTAERLRPMIGHEVTSARARPGPGLRRVPDLSRLVGARVLGVEARGKHLLIGFEGGLTLRSHMRMTGSWRLLPPSERPSAPLHRSTAIIESSAWTAVAIATPVIELLTDAELRRSEPLRSLGPDLLAAEFDTEEALDASACMTATSSAARSSTSAPSLASGTCSRARSRSSRASIRGRRWLHIPTPSFERPSPPHAGSSSPTWPGAVARRPDARRPASGSGSTADRGDPAGAAGR